MRNQLLILFLSLTSALGAQRPPNILLLIADDWSYPHAGAYGDETVRTPTFDRLAEEGVLFEQAFISSPSCSPSRAAILTGRHAIALASAGNLYGPLNSSYPNYAEQLARDGYAVGMSRKGWAPGSAIEGGYADHNPAGPQFENFTAFMESHAPGQPFCFWFGSFDPHRPYDPGSGQAAGLNADKVVVPDCWPDNEVVRNDILDYYAEIERFDRECGAIIEQLRQAGELDNTLIIMTSDNGMPFPRAKANLYDLGTRIPLVISWPAGDLATNSRPSALVSLIDLAPTIQEVTAAEPPSSQLQGRSLLPLLKGQADPHPSERELVFLGRERHANIRLDQTGYPMRAVRTEHFLYIRNFFPERWPAGDPESINPGIGPFGDCDDGPTKRALFTDAYNLRGAHRYNLAFGRRPAEELYYLPEDPDQLRNVIYDPAFARSLRFLRQELTTRMHRYQDPRAAEPQSLFFDQVPYTWPKAWGPELGRDWD
ncbi:MAG: sulfatase [Bacteroidota bacterium]